MTLRTYTWNAVRAARAIDVAMTRRDGRRDVLIDSRTAMNYAMVSPVQASLAADPRVRFYATSTSSDGPTSLSAVYPQPLPGTTLLSPSQAQFRRFDAYLTADLLWARLPRGTCRIQMFHGVAGKFAHDYDTPQSSMRRWNRFFFVNRRRMYNFIASGAIDATSDAPRLVGMPKVDCLVDGSLQRDDVLRSLNLDPTSPSVLYAPTWSAYSSLNLMGLELVAGLLSRSWNVIVKLHDRSRDPRPFYSGGVDWAARLEQVMANSRAHLVADADICPYLAAADLMITDHSSAGFEYLLLDRPLVRIHVPELLRNSNVNEEYVRLLTDAARSATDLAGVLKAVEDGLADPAAGSGSRREVARDLFHQPGSATARAAAELYEAMELAPAVLASTAATPSAVI